MELNKKDLNALYVASKCVFYIISFKENTFKSLMENTFDDKEELLSAIYYMLLEKNCHLDRLIDALNDDVDNAHDCLLYGNFDFFTLMAGQYATDLLLSIELMDRYPRVPTPKRSDIADEF